MRENQKNRTRSNDKEEEKKRSLATRIGGTKDVQRAKEK